MKRRRRFQKRIAGNLHNGKNASVSHDKNAPCLVQNGVDVNKAILLEP
jgi:hypothetical protein